MLEVKNHDGLLAFLLGMIFLVLAGVALSLVADRFSDSVGIRSELEREITGQEQEIRQLRLKLELTNSQRKQSEISHEENLEKARLTELSYGAVASRLRHLRRLQVKLTESLSAIERSFHEYRVESRERAWSRAIGDSFAELKTSDGRVFREAVIVDVTDMGISIRHSDGSSSIPSTFLSGDHWDRFQWERSRPTTPTVETTIPKVVSLKNTDPVFLRIQAGSYIPDEADLVALRAALQRAGEEVERLTESLRTVSSMAERSVSRSVPGSLDTWAERKMEIGRKLANARMEYAESRANLKILSPDDRLLDVWRMPWGSSLR